MTPCDDCQQCTRVDPWLGYRSANVCWHLPAIPHTEFWKAEKNMSHISQPALSNEQLTWQTYWIKTPTLSPILGVNMT